MIRPVPGGRSNGRPPGKTDAWLPAWLLCLAVAAPLQAEVRISGVDDEVRTNILAFLEIDDWPCDLESWQVDRALDKARSRAGEALQAFGYYQPELRFESADKADCWVRELQVQPGARTRFRHVDITLLGEAQSDATLAAVVASAPQAGAPLHHGRYTAYRNALRTALANRGYLDARFIESRLRVHPEAAAADVLLRIEGGERYRIGAIRIDESALDPELIRRLVRLEQDEPFDRSRLNRVQRELNASALVANASVIAETADAREGQVPIRIRVTLPERIGYEVGVGASTDLGPRGRAGYRNRRVNRRGHQIEADAQFAPVQSALTARYRLPLSDPLVEWQTVELDVSRERTDTSDSDAVRLGLERLRLLDSGWLFAYGVRLGETRFEVGGLREDTTLLMPVAGLSRRRADDETNPRAGSSTSLQLRGASSALLSSTDFIQLYAQHRRLLPVGRGGRLSLRAEIGTTWQDRFEELPPEVRFFAGGDQSVRGYGYETLGPVDSDGDVIGGNRLATASIEYEHPVAASWSVAAFFDVGSAFDSDQPDWQRGTGLGAVWRSPVGPLRAYLAHALDGERGVRLHVTFGADL